MIDKYCPRSEIKKLEVELWNLKVKGTNVQGYTQRFQELALLCVKMFPEECDKIEKYVGGLSDMIYGSVMASRPKTMQDAIEMATELMDKKISTLAESYAAGTGERKEYARTLPLCNRCNLHHNGPCTVKCGNCKKVGHMTRDCRNPAAARNQRTLTCYECRDQGHYRSDCLELKNQNHGNQAEGIGARGVVHALGGGEIDQDPNKIEYETEVYKRSLVVMTIGLDIPKQIVNAQTGAQKPDNLKHEDVGVVRFGKRGKLNPRYVRPFKVLAKVGAVAYKLELPQELSRVHHTFHLHFIEEPAEIMDRKVKQLKQGRIPIVKVRWNSRQGPEFT
ncbi:putative reverse transcriptase domain-containing protein [Tanacetum coccineum]